MERTRSEGRLKHPNFYLWQALIAPSAIWLAYLTASFMMAAYACENNFMWVMHAMTWVAVALSLASVWGGVKAFKHYKAAASEQSANFFLAIMALLLDALIILVLLTSELSNFMLEPCL